MPPKRKTRSKRTTAAKPRAATKPTPGGMTASLVEALLHARFNADFFTTTEFQVGGRNGPGAGGRIDYLAIRPSWSNPEIEAVEVKVSRADFLADNKWPQYLPYATRFWFATAPGIVQRDEIPEQAGWLEASANGARLFVRKKAPNLPRPEPKMEAELMRAIVHRHFYGRHRDKDKSRAERIQEWRFWVEDRNEAKTIGRGARREVHRIVQAAHDTARIATARYEGTRAIVAALAKFGVTEDQLINSKTNHIAEIHARRIIAKAMGGHGELEELRQFGAAMTRTSGLFANWSKQFVERITEASERIREALEKSGEPTTPPEDEETL